MIPAGLEPAASRLGILRSILMSYGTMILVWVLFYPIILRDLSVCQITGLAQPHSRVLLVHRQGFHRGSHRQERLIRFGLQGGG